jgi:hypothetical protein
LEPIRGLGVTRVLSYQAERAVREGKLRIVLQKFEPEPRPVSLLTSARISSRSRYALSSISPRRGCVKR